MFQYLGDSSARIAFDQGSVFPRLTLLHAAGERQMQLQAPSKNLMNRIAIATGETLRCASQRSKFSLQKHLTTATGAAGAWFYRIAAASRPGTH
jgi:hypothetical protein